MGNEKERERNFEGSKEEEVQAAYESLEKTEKKDELPSLDFRSLASRHFRLYSTDHVDYAYNSSYYPSKYVEFYYLGENGSRETERLHGHIYLNAAPILSTWERKTTNNNSSLISATVGRSNSTNNNNENLIQVHVMYDISRTCL
jgi:hypothetical protein